MARPITTTVTLAAAVANGVALAQSAVAGLPLNLNGSLAANGRVTFDAPRQVAIASSGNDTGITFTVVGTNRPEMNNTPRTEVITGSNGGTATTVGGDFASIISITPSGNSAGTVTVGTNGTGSGPWVAWNNFATEFIIGLAGFTLSGAPTWTVEYTYDGVFGLWLPVGIPFARSFPIVTMQNIVGNLDGRISGVSVRATRLTLNSAPGSVQLLQMQQGA